MRPGRMLKTRHIWPQYGPEYVRSISEYDSLDLNHPLMGFVAEVSDTLKRAFYDNHLSFNMWATNWGANDEDMSDPQSAYDQHRYEFEHTVERTIFFGLYPKE